jgi:predicted acyltransferase
MRELPAGRLLALDAFRGMTIVAMILVNTPGSWDHVYPSLLHASWVGFTFTDLIFPLFLFIAGVAMWLSLGKAENQNRSDLMKRSLKRSVLIFLVGIFISWFPFYNLSLESLHFAGVLQRIAVSYLLASLICINLNRGWVAGAALILLFGYWALVNLIGGVDPYSRDVVFERGIDNVTLVSCMSSAVPIMIGYLVGSTIERTAFGPAYFSKLIGIGFAMTLLGRLWALEFPIIKSVFWTSSYVVYSVGIGIILFSITLWIIEYKGFKRWAYPFVMFGLNPLFLYALSMVLDTLTWIIKIGPEVPPISIHEWIYRSLFQPLAGDVNGSLLYAVSYVLVFLLIAYGLFRKGIFIKV